MKKELKESFPIKEIKVKYEDGKEKILKKAIVATIEKHDENTMCVEVFSSFMSDKEISLALKTLLLNAIERGIFDEDAFMRDVCDFKDIYNRSSVLN